MCYPMLGNGMKYIEDAARESAVNIKEPIGANSFEVRLINILG